ncbi:MAG: hypothetical protein LBF69_05390 [Prevotellaceae bacterium]|jgi:hypothetical protein|nr:hypothetical protein [Prevotellaceae bacterium]
MQPAPIRIILKADGEEYICKYLPTGWRDQSASWIFDYKVFGYNLKYSTEKLRFIKEDADFIRRQIDLYGISAEIDFTVQHRQEDWTYADSFTGQVDMSDGYINDRDFVEVAVIEGGLKRAYSQNQKTNYELPLDDADAVDIEVPEGIQLYESVKYIKEGTGNVNEEKVYERLVITNSFVVSRHLMFQNQYYESQVLYPFLVAKGKEAADPAYTYPMKMYLDFTIKKTSNFTYNPVTFMITKVLHGNSANNYIAVAYYTITPAYLNNDRILFSIDFNK